MFYNNPSSNKGIRKIGKRSDLIGLTALLAAAAFYIIGIRAEQEAVPHCSVIYNRQPVLTLELTENRTISFSDLPQVRFIVHNGSIAFLESDCPDQICVNTGFIGTPGQSAACLPNRIVLAIEGDGGVDAVAD